MSRRILVLQHIDIEHPGIFRRFLGQDGIDWHAVELDRGEIIPPLERFDALWVMGGPMDVWQEQEYPWLVPEKAAIREAVAERGMPFLGLCLGHQLLAEALGGSVGPSTQPEIGVLEVNLTEAGRASSFFDGIGPTMACLQWHSAEVKTPPADAVILGSSPACAVQAMSVNDNAVSMQFHVEISADTVREWGEVPAYHQALVKHFGEDGLSRLDSATAGRMAEFNSSARTLYDNWKTRAFG